MEVIGDEIVVSVILNGTNKSAERSSITKGVVLDGLEDLGKILVNSVAAIGVSVSEILNVLGQVTKEEDVVLANLAGDFNLVLSVHHLIKE